MLFDVFFYVSKFGSLLLLALFLTRGYVAHWQSSLTETGNESLKSKDIVMKKLFFFRSSASSNANNNSSLPPLTDKQIYWEKLSNNKKQVSESPPIGTSPCLRRSLSFSSGSVYNDGLLQKNFDDEGGSLSSSNNVSLRQSGRFSSRSRTLTPERQPKAKCFEVAAGQNAQRVEKLGCVASLRSNCDLSESSSNCTSNFSNRILDRFIDGEQEENSMGKSSSVKNHIKNVNGGAKRPPRIQYTPDSSSDRRKQNPKSHSFREAKGSHFHFSSRDLVENGFGHESPRKHAKHVIERLSQSHVLPGLGSKEFDSDVPITIEDIYDGSLNRSSDILSQENILLDRFNETTNGYHQEEIPGFLESGVFSHGNCGIVNSSKTEEDIDAELFRISKEANDRVKFLNKEVDPETFLCESGISVPVLIQTIRNLTEERASMALQVSAVLHNRIADRASAREELKLARSELDSETRQLEKETNELQSTLEKELDRRSSEWSVKLEKYKAEEHRLRERVRDLAEQNVVLQRDVSSYNEREMDSGNKIMHLELQLKDLAENLEDARNRNQNMQQNLDKVQEKCREAEEDRDCMQKNCTEKERECKELHRSITRLLRTCSEQEKTIDGLLDGFSKEAGKNTSLDNFDIQRRKLQMEQIRLAGVEQALRKELESYRIEVDFLRNENINLLYPLKLGNEGGSSTFKLYQELRNRVHCIQNQGLLLLSESTQLCLKLSEYIKEKYGHTSETNKDNNGLEKQFIIDSDVKIQGFKRGIEKLSKGLETLSVVLHEKSSPANMKSQYQNLDDLSDMPKDKKMEDKIQTELRAETLLTTLLREKLYSKELEVEQLQAELAGVVRGNDILQCEVQNAMDTFSCMNHKMKDLELLMIKKDEIINHRQNDLHDCVKELTVVKGVLSTVSEERDLMWNDVKQYSERNMLLNSEVNLLKKKIKALDEDILLKEGQITILKDTLGKPFDLLGCPDSTQEFLLE